MIEGGEVVVESAAGVIVLFCSAGSIHRSIADSISSLGLAAFVT